MLLPCDDNEGDDGYYDWSELYASTKIIRFYGLAISPSTCDLYTVSTYLRHIRKRMMNEEETSRRDGRDEGYGREKNKRNREGKEG